nr:hypothetical protein HUO10_006391 [Paraburkholderia busanensis]
MNYKKSAGQRGKKIWALSAAGALSLSILAACGGGGSSSSSGTTSNATATSMSGTVAVGSAVANANVTVIDANHNTVNATSDASGNYTVSLAGLSAPYLIIASDPSSLNSALYSVVASVPAGTSVPVIANVTTLTTAVASMLVSSGNPIDLPTFANLASIVTPSTVSAAVSTLNTALASILSANGLNAASFDPIGTSFSANQSGADAVIDSVRLVPAPAGGNELISTANPSVGITLNQATTVSTPLAAPPVAANYLAALTTALGQCLSGTTASCSQAVDAGYRENGFTTLTTAHSVLASAGLTLGSPRTLQFFTSGSTQKALVLWPYTLTNGSAGSFVTVVQNTGGSAWDVIGNQQQFNVTITSFLDRREFLDTVDAPLSRFESGLSISVTAGAAGTPNPANLASVAVSGPGIGGTLYLVPRNGTGSDTLALTSSARTTVPTGGLVSNSNTTLYRWSWLALPGYATQLYTPASNSLGFTAPAPIDLSTVPQFAAYTVKFYDSTGAQIGQTDSVVNPTPTIGAAAATGVVWQTLSSATQSAFLSPGGSLAAAQGAVSLSWSNVFADLNLAPLVAKAQIQAVPGTGVTPSTEVDGWWNGPAVTSANGQYSATVTAGLAQNGVQQCSPACQFAALQAGGSRLAELYWSVGQTAYYNIWKYND